MKPTNKVRVWKLPQANDRRSLFYPIIERDNNLFAVLKLASVYCNETMEGAQHGE